MMPLGLEGFYLAESPLHTDARGSFREWFWADGSWPAWPGLGFVAQANCATSRKGTIRGIHYQPGQAKYITCVAGAVLDVAVDLRAGSPTFGQWRLAHLGSGDAEGKSVLISAGLGHAYMALTDDTVVVYLCSMPYDPAADHVINALDPALRIPWPVDGLIIDGRPGPIRSHKDKAAPTLDEAKRAGILP
jgi:dTDP-4-dehydrorhamnose 3,5-epimerase